MQLVNPHGSDIGTGIGQNVAGKKFLSNVRSQQNLARDSTADDVPVSKRPCVIPFLSLVRN
jgi:hypothetical protein